MYMLKECNANEFEFFKITSLVDLNQYNNDFRKYIVFTICKLM